MIDTMMIRIFRAIQFADPFTLQESRIDAQLGVMD